MIASHSTTIHIYKRYIYEGQQYSFLIPYDYHNETVAI